MAFERRWERVSDKILTISGGEDGSIAITDNRGFYVKQKIKLKADTLEIKLFQIKRVVSNTVMYVGPVDSNINSRSDISQYTLALNSTVSAEEQEKPKVPQIDQYNATYAQEPISARRVVSVDNHGTYYDTDNPMPVQLSDGSIDIGTVNAELEVQLSHQDNVPDAGDVADSVQIGDGEDILAINPDGSINVAIGVAGLPKTVNIPVAAANTEVTYTFTTATKRFRFKVQDSDSKAKISYTAGESGTDYWTVHRGDSYEEESLDLTAGVSMYFQLNKANQIVEILYWE